MIMPPVRELASVVPLTLVFEGEDPHLAVVHAEASSGLSRAFVMRLRVRSTGSPPAPRALIGRNVKIRLDKESDALAFDGVCTHASLRSVPTGDGSPSSELDLVLGPRSEWMRLRTDHRMFKDLTATEIAVALAGNLAHRVGEVRRIDDSELPKLEYRVQYAETDFAAMVRLLSESGVTFLYDFRKACELVLVPNTLELPAARRTIPYVENAGLSTDGEPVITEIVFENDQVAGAALVRDSWIDKPDFDAKASFIPFNRDGDLERYCYDAGAGSDLDRLESQAAARITAEATPAQRIVVTSTSFVPPGDELVIEGAPERASGALRVIAVESSYYARERQEVCHVLTCVNAVRRWVPPREPKVLIAGVQKAKVVGTNEGEVDVDAYGRVLCEFRWDRDKLVSRRVEVSQAWAGPGYGLYALPRVGDEVLVSYLDGDPDEPIVVGRVPHARNLPPLRLPEEQNVSVWRTKSTPNSEGFNEIRMDDTAGSELFSIHAELDMKTVIERDLSGSCGRDLTFVVGRHTNVQVSGLTNVSCARPTKWEGTDLMIDSSGDFQFHSMTRADVVEAAYSIQAGSLAVETIGNEEHNVHGNLNAAALGIHLFGTTDILLTVGASSISLKPGSLTIGCGGSTIELTPAAITQISALINLNP